MYQTDITRYPADVIEIPKDGDYTINKYYLNTSPKTGSKPNSSSISYDFLKGNGQV